MRVLPEVLDVTLLESRFTDLLDAMPDAIVIVDPAGRIVLVNSQTERMFGHPSDHLMGKPVELLMPERFRANHSRHRDEYVAHPRQRPMGAGLELLGLRQDGTEFPVEISLSPLDTKEGQFAISAIRDVTDRKRAEQALQAANAELESFAYSVSHDLRAPLRTVDGFSQALVEDFGALLPEEGQRQVQWIREGTQRMGRLIDDLLRLSRLSRQTLRKDKVDVGRLISAVVNEVCAQPPHSRNIDFQIGELPPCVADEALLRQVWMNLLSNAVKYTSQRERAIIEIGSSREGAHQVYRVADNGVGFDMQYVGKLFGVFQRLHRAEEYEGNGVGLAIVARIVHRHGGRVWAQAELDRGAEFLFTLEGGSTA